MRAVGRPAGSPAEGGDPGAPDGGAPDGSPVAPDGSPVAVYLAAPLEPEYTPVLARLEPPATVLDLGCGAGRLADELADRGFTVTGVDESPAMLAHVSPAVTTVRGRIEALDLPDRFDVVVLASLLVNEADPGVRAELLAAARRHVTADGSVLVEHRDPHSPVYHPGTGRRTSRLPLTDGRTLEIALRTVARDGDHVTARSEYRIGDTAWEQPFEAVLLDDTGLAEALAGAGLRLRARLDSRWVVAVPAGAQARPPGYNAAAATTEGGGHAGVGPGG